MKQTGFSLLELVVVLAIISILLAVAAISYNDWQVKYNVEKQTKELVADLNSLRLRAIHSKTLHRAVFRPESYEFRRSASDDDVYTAGPIVESRTCRYKLKNAGGSDFATKTIDFDSRGFATTFGDTIRIESPKNNAAYDCVIIAVGRTNMGKIEDGACTPK